MNKSDLEEIPETLLVIKEFVGGLNDKITALQFVICTLIETHQNPQAIVKSLEKQLIQLNNSLNSDPVGDKQIQNMIKLVGELNQFSQMISLGRSKNQQE